MAPATVELILLGIQHAPELIGTARTLVGMLSNDKITEEELLAIWTSNAEAVKAAEARWRAQA